MSEHKDEPPPAIRLGEGVDDYEVEVVWVRVKTTAWDHFKSTAFTTVGGVVALLIFTVFIAPLI